MNISNNNSIGLKIHNSGIDSKKHSLSHNNLQDILKNCNTAFLNNSADKLTLSKQALFKIKLQNLDKAGETQGNQIEDSLEHARFINMVGSIINSKLDYCKTEIEDNVKAYSSYISKVNDGTLDKSLSFDDYADSEIKNKYQSNLINTINTLVSKTDTSYTINHDDGLLDKSVSFDDNADSEIQKKHEINSANAMYTLRSNIYTSIKTQESKPSENIKNVDTKSIDDIKSQALEQLEKRIKKIEDDSVNSLNQIFTGISVSSSELSDKINELKKTVTTLASSIKEIELNTTKTKSEFAESLKNLLGNITKTQNNIRNYSYSELKNVPGLDEDNLSTLTQKYQSETANSINRYQYEVNLIDSSFN